MKKTPIKVLSTVAVLGLLTSSAAFAEYNPDKVIDPSNPIMTLSAPVTTESAEKAINVNGLNLAGSTYYTEGDVVMVPVRAIAEALGYEVGWEEEANRITLTSGAQYITMSLNEDAYTFSKMAPVKLGTAPVLVNDSTTFVPVTFLSEILGAEYEFENGTLEVIQMTTVTVKEISTEEEGCFTVEDPKLGDVIVRVTEDTVITNAGQPATFDDVKADGVISILYSPAMTMSIPPQTTAVKIEVNPNAPVENTEQDTEESTEAESAMTLAHVTAVAEDAKSITVTDEIHGEVVVHISDETVITRDGEEASAEDIKKDADILVEYSPVMTASLPPQTTAVKIELNAENAAPAEDETPATEEETVAFEGTVKEVLSDDQVLVDIDGSEVVLNCSEDTVIRHEKNKRAYQVSDLEEGMKITGEHSQIMTRSLPPQTPAYEIVIVAE